MTRTILTTVLALYASMMPAAASDGTTDVPFLCAWDAATQKIGKTGTPAFVEPAGNASALTVAWDASETYWGILHHCAADTYLVFSASTEAAKAVDLRFVQLVLDNRITAHQLIADELAPLGAQARLGKGDIGRCDCDFLTATNALN